jgi:hypothetical protein
MADEICEAEEQRRLAQVGRIVLAAWRERKAEEDGAARRAYVERVAQFGYRARVYAAPPLTFEEQFRRMQIENDRLNREVAQLKRRRR